jgi:hypothetical protein
MLIEYFEGVPLPTSLLHNSTNLNNILKIVKYITGNRGIIQIHGFIMALKVYGYLRNKNVLQI